jgi:hypothetical protein
MRLFHRRCETYVPIQWPEDPPPDIGVREPRRPKPWSGPGSALLDPLTTATVD